MGATVLDVANEYRARISALPLASASFLYHYPRNTIIFTTFFDRRNREAEDTLAKIETYMVDAFSEFNFDFCTIHLMGRNVEEFLPLGAIPLRPSQKSAQHRADAH